MISISLYCPFPRTTYSSHNPRLQNRFCLTERDADALNVLGVRLLDQGSKPGIGDHLRTFRAMEGNSKGWNEMIPFGSLKIRCYSVFNLLHFPSHDMQLFAI